MPPRYPLPGAFPSVCIRFRQMENPIAVEDYEFMDSVLYILLLVYKTTCAMSLKFLNIFIQILVAVRYKFLLILSCHNVNFDTNMHAKTILISNYVDKAKNACYIVISFSSKHTNSYLSSVFILPAKQQKMAIQPTQLQPTKQQNVAIPNHVVEDIPNHIAMEACAET